MDPDLFRRAKAKDAEAVNAIIDMVEPFILKQCNKTFLRNYDFEDKKQIAYLAVLKGIQSLNPAQLESAPSYLMKCVHNALKYETRKVLSRPDHTSLENADSDGVPIGEKLMAEDSTEDDILKLEDHAQLKIAFDMLDTEEKNIISYFIHDSYGGLKRYADLHGREYRKVRYQKDKALKKMRLFLTPLMTPPGHPVF